MLGFSPLAGAPLAALPAAGVAQVVTAAPLTATFALGTLSGVFNPQSVVAAPLTATFTLGTLSGVFNPQSVIAASETATFALGTVSVTQVATNTITAASLVATFALGTLSLAYDQSLSVSGLTSVYALGSLSLTQIAGQTLTVSAPGVAATFGLGAMSLAYNQPITVGSSVTATFALGAVSLFQGQSITASPLIATFALGTAALSYVQSVLTTGVSATFAPGAATVVEPVNQTLTVAAPVTATFALGGATISTLGVNIIAVAAPAVATFGLGPISLSYARSLTISAPTTATFAPGAVSVVALGVIAITVAAPVTAMFVLTPDIKLGYNQNVVAAGAVATFVPGPGITVGFGLPQTISVVTGFDLSFSPSSQIVVQANFLVCALTIPPGGSATFNVVFTPTAPGVRTGVLSFTSNATPGAIALSGTGAAAVVPVGNQILTVTGATATFAIAPTAVGTLLRLSTAGNQIVDSTGANVRLRSINWFGAEGTNFTPDGIWGRGYQSILNQIQALGFNCIRLPFADDILTQTPLSIDYVVNADLVGLNSLQVLDKIIAYGGSLGLYFVLDHHRCSATTGSGTDGWPAAGWVGAYTQANWLAMWTTMATRYASNKAVLGMDPHNEPYNIAWTDWVSGVATLANAIHAIAPDWLVFCEGVGLVGYTGGSPGYWWGGNLSGVASMPLVLTTPNKVVYSPHEYGLSANAQPWLESTTNTVAGWPSSLGPVWEFAWSYIFREAIAPIWVGEFGGKFGFTGSGAVDSTQLSASYEVTWLDTLIQALNGDPDLTGTKVIAGAQKGMSYSYWALNPDSADTGGLLEDDWLTVQPGKLALLEPLLTA